MTQRDGYREGWISRGVGIERGGYREGWGSRAGSAPGGRDGGELDAGRAGRADLAADLAHHGMGATAKAGARSQARDAAGAATDAATHRRTDSTAAAQAGGTHTCLVIAVTVRASVRDYG